jgi:hypothetical protein
MEYGLPALKTVWRELADSSCTSYPQEAATQRAITFNRYFSCNLFPVGGFIRLV